MMQLIKLPIKLIFGIGIIMLAACAHQQSPGGGPDDTIGPAPVTTSPKSESVKVTKDAVIEITFSEWILPTSVKGISLFPSTRIKVKVKGNRLVITPQERLRDSTTYHCVITSSLKDLHNNPIREPVSIIFSTGNRLDSGMLSGCVTDPARQELQPTVALFRLPADTADSGYCGVPDYLMQTDSNGVFSFMHIRTGPYRCISYIDKNSDYRLQNGSEDLYLPNDTSTIIGDTTRYIMLYPGVFDTTRQRIATVTTINNRTIVGTWKKPVDTCIHALWPVVALEPSDSGTVKIPAQIFQTHGSARFILSVRKQLDSIPYRLIYSTQSIFDTGAFTDTLRIDGAARPDTTPPSFIRALPEGSTGLRPSIRFIWSEPVQMTHDIYMADTLGDTVLLKRDTLYSDTSVFTMFRSLVPGSRYRCILFTSDARDLRSNPLKAKDSTDTVAIVTFAVIHPDSLAVSLSGTASCLDVSVKRKWSFKRFIDILPVTVKDNNNSFRFDSLPSGKGNISTFIDYNGNDRPDPGRLLPFAPPEPVIMFPDTIEARARWDVEGISLAPCDPCERKKIESAKIAAENDSISEKK